MNHMRTITSTFKTSIINSKIASRFRLMPAVAIVALLLASAATSQADTFTWTNAVGTAWQTTTAWSHNLFTAYTNDFTGSTNQVTNSFCVAVLPPNSLIVSGCTDVVTSDFPADADSAIFTNDTSYTLTFTGDLGKLNSVTVTSHVGTVTFNMGTSTLTLTNKFSVGVGDATSTVAVVGGSLSIASTAAPTSGHLRIGDGSNAVGTVVVNNGTVVANACTLGLSSNAVGNLIITGNGRFQPDSLGTDSTLTVGTSASANNQLIVTNGGQLSVAGTITVGNTITSANNYFLLSGPTSLGSISSGGYLKVGGTGSLVIISNGAKLFMTGSLMFGGQAQSCTGIVTGPGTQVLCDTQPSQSVQIGWDSHGATNNAFYVRDGALLTCSGTFAFGNNSFNISNGLYMGGSGLMSTGFLYWVKSNSTTTNHFGNFIIVSNAYVTSAFIQPQGPQETIAVLSKGTWVMTNSFSVTDLGKQTNCFNFGGNVGTPANSVVLIDGGTFSNLRRNDNGGGFSMGGVGSDQLIITNGGRLFTSRGTFASGGASYETGFVSGVGSVWSNFSGQASDPNFTNSMVMGTSGTAGSNNFLSFSDGAELYNGGTFSLGNSPSNSANTVRFGGAGLAAIVHNMGSFNIGSTSGAYLNALICTNVSMFSSIINVGNTGATNNLLQFNGGTISNVFMRVRATNSVVFTAGTLSIGGLTYDSLANFTDDLHTNAFVVGDGVHNAYYDMVPTIGSGTNDFNNGGLVVTNNAFLRGAGRLAGNVTVLGTFSPGSVATPIGTITTSNDLKFGSVAIINYDLGTAQDSVTVGGDLLLGGTLNVTPGAGFGVAGSPYTLFTHTNTVSGTLAVNNPITGGFNGAISNDLPNTPRILLVVTSTAPADPFTAWQTHYFPGGGPTAAGTADPDGDGVNNTNEFLSSFNPNSATAYAHIIKVVKSGSDMNITYLGANGDDTWSPGFGSRTNVLEFTHGSGSGYNGNYSNNFVTATSSTGAGISILSGGHGTGTVITVTDTGAASVTNRYYRIRVIAP
jgi:fibronectin-binding autotransporter adhesin